MSYTRPLPRLCHFRENDGPKVMDWSRVTLCSRDITPIATLPVVLGLDCHNSRKFPLGLGVCRVLAVYQCLLGATVFLRTLRKRSPSVLQGNPRL